MKFKFIPRNYELTDMEDFFHAEKIQCPILHVRVYPDGNYMIRGNKKSHRKEYIVKDNTWYLINTVVKDAGHYECDCGTFRLFPSLSTKEWNDIQKIPIKYLSKLWQRYLRGYLFWMENRRLIRDIHLGFIDDKLNNLHHDGYSDKIC